VEDFIISSDVRGQVEKDKGQGDRSFQMEIKQSKGRDVRWD